MNKARYISFASVISEIKQSDMFMSVKMRILETPKANLNGVRVTEAFIDEIIADEERYVGLPLYADVKSLTSGKYSNLGHMYNAKTGEFYSTQIGSFYQFEKETFKGGAYLVGYARIPKRNMKLSKAIAELFAEGSLKFSFEIACSDWTEDEEGIFVIDASENNYLEGTAIVTYPACEDAVALEFVAQREAGDTERGEEEMAEAKTLEVIKEVAEVEQTETAEAETTEVEAETTEVEAIKAETNETATEQVAAETQPETVAEQETEKETETAEEKTEETENVETAKVEQTEDASCKKDKENAAVHVDTTTTVRESTYAYDSETGKSAFKSVEVTEGTNDTIEGTLVETEEGIRVAEEVTAEDEEEPAAPGDNAPGDADDVPPVPEEKKKTAEEMIAELTATVKSLAEEIKSLKESRITASTEKLNIAAEAINPFVDSMTAKSKYDLLEFAEKKSGYDLLSK